VGVSNPARTLRSVDLPEPFGPWSATISPAWKATVTSRRTSPLPYVYATPEVERMGVIE
jgi:hypothetical protein